MITNADIGHWVRYYAEGWRFGKLLTIERKESKVGRGRGKKQQTAVTERARILHPVRGKLWAKVEDCEPWVGTCAR